MRPAVAGEICQIGELAARSGVTPDTLRYCERLGLLPKTPRTSGGFRMYTADAVERLRFIKQAQSVGLTLHEIRDLLGYQASGDLTRCRRVRDMLRTKLTELQTRLSSCRNFSARCRTTARTVNGRSMALGRGRPALSRTARSSRR